MIIYLSPRVQKSPFNPDDEPMPFCLKYFQLGRFFMQDGYIRFFYSSSQIDQSSVNLPWFS